MCIFLREKQCFSWDKQGAWNENYGNIILFPHLASFLVPHFYWSNGKFLNGVTRGVKFTVYWCNCLSIWREGDRDLFFLAIGILIIGLLDSWLKRDFINSITGLMTGPGTLWDESLEEQFIQVREQNFFLNRSKVFVYSGAVSFISDNFILWHL